ncbi:hypothetical protein GCM10027296_32740 [Chitinimonas naiadis]
MLAQNAAIQNPDSLDAKVAMAVVARRTQRLNGARMHLEKVLAVQPDHALANMESGRVSLDEGDLEGALKFFLATYELMPKAAAIAKDLGLTLMLLDRRAEAIPYLEVAAKGLPEDFGVHQALGVALIGRGDTKRGMAVLQKAIPGKRSEASWQWTYSQILAQGKMDAQALQAARVATEIDPKFIPAWETQYFMLHNFRDNEGALKIARKLLALEPCAKHQMMIGHMQGGLGRYGDARESFERALALDPSHLQTLSGYCFFTTYMDDLSPAQVFDIHRRYGQVVESMIKPVELAARKAEPAKKLRIGLVSADFREHAFTKWALPMLEQIDRDQYSLYYYYAHNHVDDFSMRYMATAERWRTVIQKSDSELAALIADDEIDILIDCSVHTGGNRLPVFAYKPAPVQVTWGGSPFTTGLSRIDYRISDDLLDPVGMTEQFHSEELWRLPRLAGSLEPRPSEVLPGTLPALERGFITFGAFNRIAKVNELTLSIWADVLKAVENSKLIVVTEPDQGQNGGRTAWLISTLEKHGIAKERITTLPPLPLHQYLSLYNQVDIHLDTFPYTGSTTTIDALGMGVPVVTMANEMPTSRASLVILGSVGHLEWVAKDRDDLVGLIKHLASDVEQLAKIRAALPDEVAKSPLYDAKGAAEAMQDAFRGMWRRWCEQQNKA